jgi:hypothetical protein
MATGDMDKFNVFAIAFPTLLHKKLYEIENF